MTLSHHAVVSHWKNFFIRVPLTPSPYLRAAGTSGPMHRVMGRKKSGESHIQISLLRQRYELGSKRGGKRPARAVFNGCEYRF